MCVSELWREMQEMRRMIGGVKKTAISRRWLSSTLTRSFVIQSIGINSTRLRLVCGTGLLLGLSLSTKVIHSSLKSYTSPIE
jgi:hypothetical protein